MKSIALFSLVAGTLAAVAWSQSPGDGCDGRPGPPPPPPGADPVSDLFDTDADGVISDEEIAAAIDVLNELDENGDGSLTRDELPRPPRPNERGPRRGGPARDARPQRPVQSETHTAAASGTVIFRGGFETDRRDHGRPVALIAAALGVKTQVFRDAFSGVTPARNGQPSGAEARANKDVLLRALGKYGITNERLDAVSNYYRYRPGSGSLWRHTPASAKAIVKDGKVTGFTITNPGSGYLTVPSVSVAGYGQVKVKAEIGFSRDLAKNGRITKLTVIK